MKLYRCMNEACTERAKPGYDFAGVEPVCPKCGIRGDDPRFGRLILTRKVIHFDPPSPVPRAGLGHLACDPTRAVGSGPRATGHPDHVNCPACRETAAYREAAAGWRIGDDDELPDLPASPRLSVDLSEQTYKPCCD